MSTSTDRSRTRLRNRNPRSEAGVRAQKELEPKFNPIPAEDVRSYITRIRTGQVREQQEKRYQQQNRNNQTPMKSDKVMRVRRAVEALVTDEDVAKVRELEVGFS